MYLTENLQEKWQPVLEHPDLPKIEDAYKRAVTTVILENQEKSVREDRSFMAEAAPANATGSSVDNFDPVLISLVRRAMPNLIAYDICGVQPMSGPTGLIFAMKSRFGSQAGAEALFNELIESQSSLKYKSIEKLVHIYDSEKDWKNCVRVGEKFGRKINHEQALALSHHYCELSLLAHKENHYHDTCN